jgi:hypothetical protein
LSGLKDPPFESTWGAAYMTLEAASTTIWLEGLLVASAWQSTVAGGANETSQTCVPTLPHARG